MAAHYDDPSFSYKVYWYGREYEHLAEVIALNRFIGHHQFSSSADIGGGFGRLTYLLSRVSQKTYLVEPSLKQIKLAKKVLSSYSNTSTLVGTANNTHLPGSSLDLALLVRVFHHLPKLDTTFDELNRILKPNGLAIIEFANSTNIKSKLVNFLTGRNIPDKPIEKRSEINIKKHTIPFVNHHPDTIYSLLNSRNFEVLSKLSVSNFRSPLLKKILPVSLLLVLEWITQPILSFLNFGPSIFLLIRKPE